MATLNNTSIRGADVLSISARLGAFASREEEGGYSVFCPVLDVCSQGNTLAEAKKNIAEAVGLFMETCYEMGTLAEVLTECGFAFPGQKKPKRKKRARRVPSAARGDKCFRFSAKVAFAVAR